jgi:hypothetical protein
VLLLVTVCVFTLAETQGGVNPFLKNF